MKENFKMLHVRNEKNKGVISFRIHFDREANLIYWTMSVCSKKDQFRKSIAVDMCKNNPLKHGIVGLSPELIKHFTGRIHKYLELKVMESALTNGTIVGSDGVVRHTPKWVYKLLLERVTTKLNL